jgi:hypothetical protein
MTTQDQKTESTKVTAVVEEAKKKAQLEERKEKTREVEEAKKKGK